MSEKSITISTKALAKLMRVVSAANQMNGLVSVGGIAGRYQGELALAVASVLADPEITAASGETP